MTDETKLKPCPFCGEVEVQDDLSLNAFICDRCGAVGPEGHRGEYDGERKKEYASLWNTRAAPPVKPLEWDGRRATGSMFQYRVHIGYGSNKGNYALTLLGSTIGEFHTEDAAKAAAQADYERRILGALEIK